MCHVPSSRPIRSQPGALQQDSVSHERSNRGESTKLDCKPARRGKESRRRDAPVALRLGGAALYPKFRYLGL